jgi:hypothetical protein
LWPYFQASADDESGDERGGGGAHVVDRDTREVLRTFLATKVVPTVDRNLRRIVEVQDAVLDESWKYFFFSPNQSHGVHVETMPRPMAQKDLRSSLDALRKSFPTTSSSSKRSKHLASHQTVERLLRRTPTVESSVRPDIPGPSLPQKESENHVGVDDGSDTEAVALLKQRLEKMDLEVEHLRQESEVARHLQKEPIHTHTHLHPPPPNVNTDDDDGKPLGGGDSSWTTNVYLKLEQLKKDQEGVHEKLDTWKLEQDRDKKVLLDRIDKMKQELLGRIDNARPAPTKPETVSHELEKQMLENEKQILENGKQILDNKKQILE